jgi:hypothetical protein
VIKLKDYQNRVYEEKKELDIKIEKLAKFVSGSTPYNELEESEKFRLTLQLDTMLIYSKILSERIMNFK